MRDPAPSSAPVSYGLIGSCEVSILRIGYLIGECDTIPPAQGGLNDLFVFFEIMVVVSAMKNVEIMVVVSAMKKSWSWCLQHSSRMKNVVGAAALLRRMY